MRCWKKKRKNKFGFVELKKIYTGEKKYGKLKEENGFRKSMTLSLKAANILKMLHKASIDMILLLLLL